MNNNINKTKGWATAKCSVKYMKVFEFNLNGESYWVASMSLLLAIKFMQETDNLLIKEVDVHDTVIELSEKAMDEIKITNTDYDNENPDDWMEKSISQIMEDITGEETQMLATSDQ